MTWKPHLLAGCMLFGGAACDTADPTHAVVENAYPATSDGGDPALRLVVYKAWWVETLFAEPVVPGAVSEELRSTSSFGVAIALLAPGWDPASGTPPTSLVVVKSKEVLRVKRGETLHIVISDETFGGNCAAKQALTQDEADFVTGRIFPGDFANRYYDAKTCTLTASAPVPGPHVPP